MAPHRPTAQGGVPLAEVARALADAAGVSLGDGLDAALADALARAARALGIGAGEAARRMAARDPAALGALVEHAAVGETAFWRHPEQLAAVSALARASAAPLRIWSAGCATGEEPYSVAMALLEAGRAGRGDRVLATDVSARALEAARAAVYGARALRKLPPAVAARWVEPGEPRRVAAPARALVAFARHNLVADPPPEGGGFDLVLCRNVLIYFEPPTAAEVLRRVAGALRPGGALLLGPVELPLASGLDLGLERIEREGATLLRRP